MDVDNEFLVAVSLAEPIGFGEVGEHGTSGFASAGGVYLDSDEEGEGEKGDCGLHYNSHEVLSN